MDSQYLYLFNRTWTSPALDWVMALASNLAFWAPLLILILGLTLVFGGFRARMFILCTALILGLGDGVMTKSLKKAVARPRPNDVRNDVRMVDLAKASPRFLALGKPLKIKMSRISEKPVAGNSFPSAHTVNNFAFATVLTTFYRRRGWLAFLPALLVGYSRVYVGAHWPGDVLVSSLLGIGWAAVMLCLLAAIWKKWAARWFPVLAAQHPDLFA